MKINELFCSISALKWHGKVIKSVWKLLSYWWKQLLNQMFASRSARFLSVQITPKTSTKKKIISTEHWLLTILESYFNVWLQNQRLHIHPLQNHFFIFGTLTKPMRRSPHMASSTTIDVTNQLITKKKNWNTGDNSSSSKTTFKLKRKNIEAFSFPMVSGDCKILSSFTGSSIIAMLGVPSVQIQAQLDLGVSRVK